MMPAASAARLSSLALHAEMYADARRVMLNAWEGWTAAEPPEDAIVHELLSTWRAMATMCGIESVGDALAEIALQIRGEELP